jgi:1L-myo-inositol 1-phosphate cytidylyltransferase / CDP-L-myo-inositol myo-inositolphosphotransferase
VSGRPPEPPVGVILAAGCGSRLGNGSKPLTTVAGLTLLERAVRTLRRAGVCRIVVVVGHAKDLVERYVAERTLGVEIVENEDFARGNGSSALLGGRVAGCRFLVTMADHVVEPDAVAKLVSSRARLAAAIDSGAAYADIEEATKVRLAGGRVVAIGRDLDEFDGVDAGLFVCDADMLPLAEHALADGDGSWTAVRSRWIADGFEIEAVDLDGAFWIDVDTPAEVRRAERLLLQRAADKSADGPVARHLNRRLSRPLSRLALRLGLRPNAVTALATLVTLAAAGALALGSVWPATLVAGGVLVQLSSVVDGVDGEVARATLQTTAAGAFLDSVLDRLGDVAILVGLAVGAGFDTVASAVLAAAIVGTLLVPYARARFEASFGRPFPQRITGLGASRDVRLLVLALFAVAMQPFLALAVAAALANLEAVRRVLAALGAARVAAPAAAR